MMTTQKGTVISSVCKQPKVTYFYDIVIKKNLGTFQHCLSLGKKKEVGIPSRWTNCMLHLIVRFLQNSIPIKVTFIAN